MIYIKSSATVISETGALNLARIGYQNLARSLAPTASSEASGFPALAARNSDTYEAWKPSAVPAWWKVDLGSAQLVNYVGIAAHTLGTAGARIKVQYSSDDSVWNDASDASVEPGSIAPSDDSDIMFLFPGQTARYWRIYIEDAIPTIGVVFLGAVLVAERPMYQGLVPVDLARVTVTRPNTSERGQILGRSIIRSGLQTSVSWKNITIAWYRTYFDPFAQSARSWPFFFAWRPGDFPTALAYGFTDDDIKPTNTGPKSYVSMGFTLKGVGYV